MWPLAAGPFGLNDYIWCSNAFYAIGSAHLHVIAVCQATVPASATSALLASAGIAEPLSLTLMGGPSIPRLHPTAIDQLAQAHNIDGSATWQSDRCTALSGSGRRVYPGSIQHAAIVAAEAAQAPSTRAGLLVEPHFGRYGDDAQNLRSLREYSAVLDMAGTIFST